MFKILLSEVPLRKYFPDSLAEKSSGMSLMNGTDQLSLKGKAEHMGTIQIPCFCINSKLVSFTAAVRWILLPSHTATLAVSSLCAKLS